MRVIVLFCGKFSNSVINSVIFYSRNFKNGFLLRLRYWILIFGGFDRADIKSENYKSLIGVANVNRSDHTEIECELVVISDLVVILFFVLFVRN